MMPTKHPPRVGDGAGAVFRILNRADDPAAHKWSEVHEDSC